MAEEHKRNFGEQLMQCESVSPSLAERYRDQMQAIMESKLSRPMRWLSGVMGGVCLAAGVYVLLAKTRIQLPLMDRFRLCSALASFGVAGWFLWLAIRGRANRRAGLSVGVLGAIVCGFGGVLFMELAWAAADPVTRGRLMLAGICLLALLGVTLVLTVIEDFYRRTEEKLLRLECRLAELSEKLDRKG